MQSLHTNEPILVFIRGLPGSGKSFLTDALQQAITTPMVVLDPDATDYTSEAYLTHVRNATAEGVDPSLHAYRFLRAQAQAGIAGAKIVLWNQPFTNRQIFQKMVVGLQAYAQAVPTKLHILIVEVSIPQSIARQRVTTRKQAGGHGPTDDTFDRFSADYASFADEGFPTVAVDGTGTIDDSVKRVLVAIDQLQHM